MMKKNKIEFNFSQILEWIVSIKSRAYIFFIIHPELILFISHILILIFRYYINLEYQVYMDNPEGNYPEANYTGSASTGNYSGGPGGPDPNDNRVARNMAMANANAAHTDSESDGEGENEPNYDNWTEQQLSREFYSLKDKNVEDRKELKTSVTTLKQEIRSEVSRLPPVDKEIELQKIDFAKSEQDRLAQARRNAFGESLTWQVDYEEASNDQRRVDLHCAVLQKANLIEKSPVYNKSQILREFNEGKKYHYRILKSLGYSTKQMRIISEKINDIRSQR